MSKAIGQFATTALLLVVLLLLVVRCSGEAIEGNLGGVDSHAAVNLELQAPDLVGVQTRDLGLCVAEFRLYPNDLAADVVRVPVRLQEIQFSEQAVSLGRLRQVPSNSYYLVELVLRDQCGGASSTRFLKGEQYFTSNEELVLRFRGNVALGYNETTLGLDVRRFLVVLDSVKSPEDIKRFLHASEGSF